MSHHGSTPFGRQPEDERHKADREKLLNALMDTNAFRGALGDFPEGRLMPSDEGAIQFGVGEKKGKVILDFGTPVCWMGMTPQEAADLAALLLKRAREISRKNGHPLHFSM